MQGAITLCFRPRIVAVLQHVLDNADDLRIDGRIVGEQSGKVVADERSADRISAKEFLVDDHVADVAVHVRLVEEAPFLQSKSDCFGISRRHGVRDLARRATATSPPPGIARLEAPVPRSGRPVIGSWT